MWRLVKTFAVLLSFTPRLIPPAQRRTFRREGPPVMDDHLFVSRALTERVTSCLVMTDEAANPSDHLPVVLELAG